MRVICTEASNDEQLFTRGACFVLGIVLHGESGYELIEVCRSHSYDCHIMVRRPSDGMYLDIRGYQTEEQVRERWGRNVEIGPGDLNDLLFNWKDPFGFKESYARALEIAQDLINDTYEEGVTLWGTTLSQSFTKVCIAPTVLGLSIRYLPRVL